MAGNQSKQEYFVCILRKISSIMDMTVAGLVVGGILQDAGFDLQVILLMSAFAIVSAILEFVSYKLERI